MTNPRSVIGVLVMLLVSSFSAQTAPADDQIERLPFISAPTSAPDWQATPLIEAGVGMTGPPGRPGAESTLYSRIDYFHWNERIGGGTLLNESGPLWTLGYQRRTGLERFRGEFFSGTVNYASQVDYANGTSEAYTSLTRYMGLKGEYDLLYEPASWPSVAYFGGIGTRFWIRDLPDAITPSGTEVWGYQETWWTVYPYLGAERRRIIQGGPEMYWSGRIGLTARTFVHGSSLDDTRLYPQPGIMGTLECGVRGPHLFLSAFAETFNWRQSPEMRGWLQPASSLVMVGLKTGVSF
jgi:hypothetical protein